MSEPGFAPRAYLTVPPAPPRRRPLPDPAAGVWADLEVAGEALAAVHAGSGVPVMVEDRLVAGLPLEPGEGSRRPVIPGSGVKGALRSLFEAVTYSCDPLSERACSARARQCCPACALFGRAGLRGAVAVSDFEVDGGLSVERIAQRYTGVPRGGRRVHGLEPEPSDAVAEELLLAVRAGSRLAGTLALRGAEPWAAGVLALVAGLAPAGLPLLRLGGGKSRGLGATRLGLRAGAWAGGRDAWLRGDRAPLDGAVPARWVDAALASDRYRSDQLERVRTLYGGGFRG